MQQIVLGIVLTEEFCHDFSRLQITGYLVLCKVCRRWKTHNQSIDEVFMTAHFMSFWYLDSFCNPRPPHDDATITHIHEILRQSLISEKFLMRVMMPHMASLDANPKILTKIMKGYKICQFQLKLTSAMKLNVRFKIYLISNSGINTFCSLVNM